MFDGNRSRREVCHVTESAQRENEGGFEFSSASFATPEHITKDRRGNLPPPTGGTSSF